MSTEKSNGGIEGVTYPLIADSNRNLSSILGILDITEQTYNEETNTSYSPNIVFGWDIRPSEFGDWWILRTNLRYFPQLKINKGANYLSLQHLEFNFIQLVIYPQKLFWIQNQ